MTPLITSRTDWTPQIIQDIYEHIEDVAVNDLKLDVYQNQIEIISAEQMIGAYSAVGMPINYNHWSFGKDFVSNMQKYQKGRMGLAYEIVINTDPCIAYLMEENNAVTQALVMAHASFGHNFVFKNNYLFKEWTAAGSIIDYMLFAKNYIKDCEQKYGADEVEKVLDAAHSISSHGVDKTKRKHKRKLNEEQLAEESLRQADEEQKNLNIILKKTTIIDPLEEKEDDIEFEGEENLIYFIYKNAPDMPQWKREILRIVYKIRNYFYHQGHTKTLNEGMATFTHFYIMDNLEKRGLISSDAQIAWLHLHSNVIFQPDMNSIHYDGSFNPYALGFAILTDLRRICENPTREDEEWFPNIVGKEWRDIIKEAVSEYRDESFIDQFLSPNLMRKMRMFSVRAKGANGVVEEISDEIGYRNLRSTLSKSYNMINFIPEIVVKTANFKGDRTLTLEYKPFMNKNLYMPYVEKVLNYIKSLWVYNVELIKIVDGQKVVIYRV